jgi:hypothetical protein
VQSPLKVRIRGPITVFLLAITLPLAFGPFTGGAGASTSSVLAHAKTQLLKLSDLPSGWTASRSDNSSASSTDPLGSAQVASCIGVPKSVLDAKHHSVSSSNFTNSPSGGSLQVFDTIDVFSTSKVLHQHHAAIERSKTPRCVQTALNGAGKAAIDKAFAPAQVFLLKARKDATANFAPAVFPLSIDWVLSEQGQSIPVSLTIVFFAKGNEEQKLGFVAINGTFPATLSKHLTAVALGRL